MARAGRQCAGRARHPDPLLRELARQAKQLGQPGTAAQWRERLLKLLDALLPGTPAAPARPVRWNACERWSTTSPRPPRPPSRRDGAAEVVRAHFAEQLARPTRAPLLTGGISFGRMVPMRLLPFRAICLLGMNDGDFPRRDPAAGSTGSSPNWAPRSAARATAPPARTTASCSCS
jgi:exodeoxyribonuclease V gamma subunit